VTIYATREELEQIGQTIVDAATKMVKEMGLDDVDGSIAIGNPARQIVKKAEDMSADMIVMGTRGLGDWKSLLVGSVSHKVMQLAPCTCVTVR
jgi:nucleotide-binding universal stress UspA family protein